MTNEQILAKAILELAEAMSLKQVFGDGSIEVTNLLEFSDQVMLERMARGDE